MTATTLSKAASKVRDRILSYVSFRAFTWIKLPLAAIAGLRVRALAAERCEVTVPFGWRTQNPFRSMYFAAHAMAAEMSTGALVLLHTATDEGVSVSTLITTMQATYGKAAKADVTYRCEDGEKIAEAARRAIETGEPAVVEVTTRGFVGGELSAEFKFSWSMKRRQRVGPSSGRPD